jgi:ribulose-5-phosphate 4-epimerase/fuculose-1-phosphate aldolase
MTIKHEISQQIVDWGRILEEKGFVNALEGNVSILDREEGLLYITPTSKSKALLSPDMVSIMDRDGKQVGGTLKRSSEYLLHEAALKCRPDCNAAIHSHAPFLTAYAFMCKDVEIKCASTFFIACGHKIPCLPYGEAGTPEIYNGIGGLIKDNNIILLGNHGVLCVEKDLESAARLIEGAEAVVKTYFIAKMLGEVKDIPPDKAEHLLANHPGSKYYKGKK